ncbi:MAG: EamA family transporter [Minisyncoccales bacterium]|jgi:hypothetical protein
MSWLPITTIAYLLLALVSLFDKYLLTDKIPNPKIYAFYTSFFRGAIIFLIPIVGFTIMETKHLITAFLAGASFYIALLFFYKSVKEFEVSRIVPAVGALVPIFSLALAFIFSQGNERLTALEVAALILLISGSFLINYKKGVKFTPTGILFAALTSLFFANHFILAKYLYIAYPFWTAIISINLGGFVLSLFFLSFSKEIRKNIFSEKTIFNSSTALLFFSSKGLSAIGGLFQNLAIFLAPTVSTVAIINGLQGVQYAFLLIITVLISIKLPKILKEEISKEAIVMKSLAIFLIFFGMVILAFSGL